MSTSPDKGAHLKSLTEVVENGPEGGRLDKVEQAKGDPVSQPLLVVVLAGGLKRLNAQVGREDPSDQVGDRGRKAKQVEKDQKDKETSETQNSIDLGNLGLGFKLSGSGELGELTEQHKWV